MRLLNRNRACASTAAARDYPEPPDIAAEVDEINMEVLIRCARR
jgi:hypothetical protein